MAQRRGDRAAERHRRAINGPVPPEPPIGPLGPQGAWLARAEAVERSAVLRRDMPAFHAGIASFFKDDPT